MSCPCCGKSTFDDSFCGSCESEYQREQENDKNETVAYHRRKIDTCSCRGGEPCQGCYQSLAAIAYAEGDYAKGDYWINH